MSIILPSEQRERLLSHCLRERPREACGLLLGVREGGRWRVSEALPARNAETARPGSRFDVAPEDLVNAESRARDRGWELLGAWHSHPAGGAEPSRADRASAQFGWLMLIAGLGGAGAPSLRAWRVEAGDLVEEALLTPEG